MKVQHVLFVAAYCAFIFWLSSGPVAPPKGIQFDGMDKLAHAVVYAILASLVFHGLRQSGRPWSPRSLVWIPVVFAAFYGASDEFHQYFVPTRSCDLFDWLADVGGGLAVAAALSFFLRRLGRAIPETLASPGE